MASDRGYLARFVGPGFRLGGVAEFGAAEGEQLLGEGFAEGVFDLFDGWARGPELLGEAGDGSPDEATGHDEAEVLHDGVDVEGESVHGDPSLNADADRGDFCAAGASGAAGGGSGV